MPMTVMKFGFCLLAMVLLVFSTAWPVPSVAAEKVSGKEFDAIKKEYEPKLSGEQDDKTRIEAIEKLAATDNIKALKLLVRHFGKEKKRLIKDHYARAFGSFTEKDCVGYVEDKFLMKLVNANQIYFAYHILSTLVKSDHENTRPLVEKALKNKSIWLRSAALEAIGDSGLERYRETILNYLHEDDDEWDKTQQILPITAVHAAMKLKLGSEELVTVMEALVGMLERYTNDRVKYHVAMALAQLGGQKEITAQVSYWRWLIEKIKKGEPADGEDAPERKRSRTEARPRFVEMEAIGKRIVFVIDVSHSMKEKLSKKIKKDRKEEEDKGGVRTGGKDGDKDDKEKEKKKKGLPWDKINTKLDLAKEDLILAIDSLTDQYQFNVVVYSTDVGLLNDKQSGFIKADAANRKKFKKLVKKLEPMHRTNIHGAMVDAFQIIPKGMIDADPAADEQALLGGADTIFFLTDGWGTWDDYSEKGEEIADPRRPKDKTPSIGNGPYILGDAVLAEFKRINKFRKVVVNTVGIGNHDKQLMEGMAKSSGGKYVDLTGK